MKQYFRYTAGRMETPADRALIRKAFEDFRESAVSFQGADSVVSTLREFPIGRDRWHVASNH